MPLGDAARVSDLVESCSVGKRHRRGVSVSLIAASPRHHHGLVPDHLNAGCNILHPKRLQLGAMLRPQLYIYAFINILSETDYF